MVPQTRRHARLRNLLRVPSVVFAANKLDAVADSALACAQSREALLAFSKSAGIKVFAVVPVAALKGWNVVDAA